MKYSTREASELPYYVYTWAYPDGEVFYVGMGQGERWTSMVGRNHLVAHAVHDIEYRGDMVQRAIVARFKVRQHAQVYERMLIETYGLEHLFNVKSEQGHVTRRLAKPFQASTIELVVRDKTKTIDNITFQRTTTQAWEDEGAAI